MFSKILVITDMSEQSSVSVLDAFQMVQKNQPSVRVVFSSYLSDLFKKSLGPNILNHWIREEEGCIERVKGYFNRMDIPHEVKVIPVPPWQMIFQEMRDGDHDLIILQGGLPKLWRRDGVNCGLCFDTLRRSSCPILVTPQFEGNLLLSRFASIETSCNPDRRDIGLL